MSVRTLETWRMSVRTLETLRMPVNECGHLER